MNVNKFNAKYLENGFILIEDENYNPEYDDCKYYMYRMIDNKPHNEAGFNTIAEAENYIMLSEKAEGMLINFEF